MIEARLPPIGLGTWNLRGNECTRVVEMARDLGYRHIDTAAAYENHGAIGRAIPKGRRGEFFLTSKIGIGRVTQELTLEQVDESRVRASVERACDEALKELGTDYLDLYLIHWPNRSHPIVPIFEALTSLVEKGKIRFPGVANFVSHHLSDLYEAGLSVPYNQIEMHPYLAQTDLRAFCKAKGTELIAYRPFGKGVLLETEPLFAQIGKTRGMSPGQVVLAWIRAKGVSVVPKGSTKNHLKENLEAEKCFLTTEELFQIDQLDRGRRFCNLVVRF